MSNKKNDISILEVKNRLLKDAQNMTVDQKSDILLKAYDAGEFGTKEIGKLQSAFGDLYPSFVRKHFLR